nr:LacI family DNA-binding transcriptional regulator [Azomonas macrocytogenes]
MPSRGRVTISEVASAAGVSKASVSRYIGGDRQLLAEATAERIAQTIERLGFRPNQMARGLKRGRTRLIGMLVADILNPYSVAVMHGVETACQRHGYTLVVCNTNRDDEQECRHLAALQSYNVEGLIVNTLGHHAGELKDLQNRLPLVLVDRQMEGFEADLVGLDNTQAVRQAIDHLQQRGYRDLLLVSEPLDGTSSRQERAQAFRTQIAANPSLKGRLLETNGDFTAKLKTFLTEPGPGPKAVFAANGMAALTSTASLRELGCRLFEDIGLIALDDLDWYPLVGNGGITALAQPTEAIGITALEYLLARLNGSRSAAQRMAFPAELRIRGSTQPRIS